MEARDHTQPSDSLPSPVCPATNFFEDAYNMMEFDDTDYMQEVEINDGDGPQCLETLTRSSPLDVLGAPELNCRETDHQDQAVRDPQVESEKPQISAFQTVHKHENAPARQRSVSPITSGSIPRGLTDIPRAQEDRSTRTPFIPQALPARVLESRGRGEVRVHAAGIDFRETTAEKWLPAVYHYNLRRQYILQTAGNEYDFPDPPGKDILDITTYHPDYKDWGPAWSNRPQILKRFTRNEYPIPSYDPGVLIDRGRVVIDQENHAVKAWKELPLCISSKVPGYKMEAWRRLNPRIQICDFLARMVKMEKPLNSNRNKLSMRMTRFRLKGACISWVEREGCPAIKAYMSDLIGPACVAANSTVNFGRDLTDAEVAKAVAANKGKFPERRRGKVKLESGEQEHGTRQHPLVLVSDEDEEEEVKTDEEDGYIVAPTPKRLKPTAAPLARPAACLTEASRPNSNESMVVPQRRRLRNFREHTGAAIPSSSGFYPYDMLGSSFTPGNSQHPRLQNPRRYVDAAAISIRANPIFTAPRNQAEAASIQQALQYTRDDFILHYSEEAPLTDVRQSYAMQWNELSVAFLQRWFFPGRPPRLTSIDNWGDTVMNWLPPG